ncbi:class I SAM-dependent methyltransferase [Virgibacillus ihumii]|uniref:class I SAM-dependent methyltransferase n=1 Tax=Virgibacillus ihumii TaxID=2686091 RepID=UPI001FE90F1D|nr:class I SAM-dependent methyltransferase [Virgibacillus ihumii]
MLKENAVEEQLENIHYVESNLDHIRLDDNSLSKVMISFIMHEVPDIEQTLDEIKRILMLIFFLGSTKWIVRHSRVIMKISAVIMGLVLFFGLMPCITGFMPNLMDGTWLSKLG